MPIVGGVRNTRNVSRSGSTATTPNPSYSQLVKQQPVLKTLITSLGYSPKDIQSFKLQNGAPSNLQMSQIALKELSQSAQQILKSLGIESTMLALVSAEVSTERLKKAFREISDTIYDRTLIEELANILGVTISEDALLFDDKKGGFLLIQNGLDQVKFSNN